jgi:hypothetical protein
MLSTCPTCQHLNVYQCTLYGIVKGALDWCIRYIYRIIIINNEATLIILFGIIVYISYITIFFLFFFFVSDDL